MTKIDTNHESGVVMLLSTPLIGAVAPAAARTAGVSYSPTMAPLMSWANARATLSRAGSDANKSTQEIVRLFIFIFNIPLLDDKVRKVHSPSLTSFVFGTK